MWRGSISRSKTRYEIKQYRVQVSNRFADLEDWMQMWKLIVLGKGLERI
jgi:hypothetical protein